MPLRTCIVDGVPAVRVGRRGAAVTYGHGTGRTALDALRQAHGLAHRRAARRLAVARGDVVPVAPSTHADSQGIPSVRIIRTDAPRRGPYRGRQPVFSPRITREHERMLHAQVALVQRLVDDLVLPELPTRGDAAQRADGLYDAMQVLQAIRYATVSLAGSAEQGLRFLGEELDDDVTDAVDDQLARLFNIPLATAAGAAGLVAEWVADNVSLISSITSDLLDEVETMVSTAMSQGTPTLRLRDQIQERFSVSRSRASLIARDQTAKLAGRVQQQRQTDYGITQFMWSTSGDSRVRQKHADLDGQIYEWKTGAPGGIFPGQEFQCRCTAEPVLPDEDVAELRAAAIARQEAELSLLQVSPTVQGAIPNYSGFSDWNAARIAQLREGVRGAVGLPSLSTPAKPAAAPSWKKAVGGGYTLSGTRWEGASLAKQGRRWILTTPSGETVDLGTRATFSTAEEALQSL